MLGERFRRGGELRPVDPDLLLDPPRGLGVESEVAVRDDPRAFEVEMNLARHARVNERALVRLVADEALGWVADFADYGWALKFSTLYAEETNLDLVDRVRSLISQISSIERGSLA